MYSGSYVLLVEKQNKDISCIFHTPSQKKTYKKLFLKQWLLFYIFLKCILSKVFTMNKIQLIFIIPRFHVCDFCYSLKFVTLKSILAVLSQSFTDMHRITKNLSHLTCMFAAWVDQGRALPSCFGSHTINRCPFHSLFSATFLVFLLVIFGLKWSPIAEVLSCVPKCKTVMCLTEKIHVLGNLLSGMS